MEKERERQASGAGRQPAVVNEEELLLASSSPRRAEILRAVGWPFVAFAVNIDESPRVSEQPVAYVERLAREKALAAAQAWKEAQRLVLGADTIVVADGSMLGKPRDADDARRAVHQFLIALRFHGEEFRRRELGGLQRGKNIVDRDHRRPPRERHDVVRRVKDIRARTFDRARHDEELAERIVRRLDDDVLERLRAIHDAFKAGKADRVSALFKQHVDTAVLAYRTYRK